MGALKLSYYEYTSLTGHDEYGFLRVEAKDGVTIRQSSNYSTFGSPMPGRKFVSGQKYRYGYQNQEEDPEIWGGAVSYKYRMEDPRLGRFFSVDPLAAKYSYNSPYAFSENRVIDGVELEGLEVVLVGGTFGANYFIAGGLEGGVVFGPDGVYAYGAGALGLASTPGANAGVSVTYFGDMKTVDDAGGLGFSAGTGAGEGVYLAENTVYSSGHVGINVQAGLTGKVFAGFVQGSASLAKIDKNMVLEKSTVQAFATMAIKVLTQNIESNKQEIQTQKAIIAEINKDSQRLEGLLEKSDNLENSQRIDAQLDRNRYDKARSQGKIGELEKANKDAEGVIKMINETSEKYEGG